MSSLRVNLNSAFLSEVLCLFNPSRTSGAAADHLSPPSTASRLSDSEVSEPDFDADGVRLTTTEKAKNRAWVRQEAASLSGKHCGPWCQCPW